MADDVTLPGTGTVVASDDVGGVQYQKVKLFDSTNGSSTEIGTTSNPLKVAEIESDCTSVLSTTITTASVTSGIDTTGYGALVWQISGVWQGNAFFEASNDGTVWDTILVFSRDNLSLQDIITSGGLYTIRPSGKYVRLNVTNITGSMTVNAIGREAEGIAAADLLSLAMEPNNNTPLYVSGRGDPAYLSNALPVAIAQEQFEDKHISIDCTTGLPVASNALTGNYNWLDVGGYSIAYISYTGSNPNSASYTLNLSNTMALERPGANSGTGSHGAMGYLFTPNNGSGAIIYPQLSSYSNSNTLAAGGTFVVFLTGRYLRMRIGTAPLVGGAVNVRLSNKAIPHIQTYQIPFSPSTHTLNSAATTNATIVLAQTGRLLALSATNNGAAVCFLKLYNKSSTPVPGTDTPVLVVSLPANGVPVSIDCGSVGIKFGLGIGYAITNLITDSDTTAIAANQAKVMTTYTSL